MPPTIGAHPARLDLAVRAGEPLDFSVPVLQANRAPVSSLSGWTAAAAVLPDAPNAALVELPVVLVDGAARVTVPGATTAEWATSWGATSGRWDLALTDPADARHVLCAGWLQLYPTVTPTEEG